MEYLAKGKLENTARLTHQNLPKICLLVVLDIAINKASLHNEYIII